MMHEHTFAKHLQDAIAVNRQRRPFYAARSHGQALFLSNLLIGLERALLPVACFVDWRARRFNRCRIPIIRNDFVPMHPLPAPGTPPVYRGLMTSPQRKDLTNLLRAFRSALFRAVRRGDFADIQAASRQVLSEVNYLEHTWHVHLAMTKHLTESILLSAHHAPAYAAQSTDATVPLSTFMIASQALLLPFAPAIDYQAQQFHRRGVGILVNDLPAILPPPSPSWPNACRNDEADEIFEDAVHLTVLGRT